MNKTAQQLEQSGFDPDNGPLCPYCNGRSHLKWASSVYGPGTYYGTLWVCENYPECDSYIGTHKTGEWKDYPLGRLANSELRNAKKQAHSVFDMIWKKGIKDRGEAYRWLQEELQLSVEDCHIGEMNEEQCNKVYELCSKFIQSNFTAFYE